jgi:hypothetical protein
VRSQRHYVARILRLAQCDIILYRLEIRHSQSQMKFTTTRFRPIREVTVTFVASRTDRYLGALDQMVMTRLERIRKIVRVRRSQRRESDNEIAVGMDMEEALMCRTLFMVYLLVFEDEISVFCYLHDGNSRNWYTRASFQTLYNPLPPYKRGRP